jgi:hypothetical protein
MIWCVSMKILLECLMTLKACVHIRWEVIDWLVFNANFSSISAISWHEQILFINLNQTWRWSVLLWWKLCNF